MLIEISRRSSHHLVAAETDRYVDFGKRLRPYICDTIEYMNAAIRGGKRVLLEGANAAMLDIDFGTYPFVTSSSPTIGGACTGLGIAATTVKEVFGVVKAYTTRVGSGPFPTEQLNSVGEHMQTVGREWGTTTGRKRRCGWLDLVVVRYTHLLNGYTAINLTKLDILSGVQQLRIATAYEIDGKRSASMVCSALLRTFHTFTRQALTHTLTLVHRANRCVPCFFPSRPLPQPARLQDLERAKVVYVDMPGWTEDISECRTFAALPAAARAYVEFIEREIGVHIRWIGVGAARDAMIVR